VPDLLAGCFRFPVSGKTARVPSWAVLFWGIYFQEKTDTYRGLPFAFFWAVATPVAVPVPVEGSRHTKPFDNPSLWKISWTVGP